MSRSGRITRLFAGQKRVFRLTIPRLEELQEVCNAGPRVILARIQTGAWRSQDIRDTLRLGLVGAEMKDQDAVTLIDRYAGDGQLQEHEGTAAAILLAALVGSPDGEGEEAGASGEPTGETKAATGSPTQS